MTKTIEVVFDGETLRPKAPLDLEPDTSYRISIELPSSQTDEAGDAWDVLEALAGSVEAPADSMRAYRLNVTVPEDRHLRVDLPTDFPPGPAEIIVLAESPESRTVARLGGVLEASSAEPGPDEDPIAEALDELRSERADDGRLTSRGIPSPDSPETRADQGAWRIPRSG